MSDPICSIEGCDERSKYLLPPEGDLCRTHAEERHPDTIGYFDWVMACNQDALDDEERQ